MFRLLVIGKSETAARDAAEWAVSGEKMGDTFEKKYEIAGRTISLKATSVSVEKAGHGQVCDGVMIVSKAPTDLADMETLVNTYMKVPIKFILYDGAADQTEY